MDKVREQFESALVTMHMATGIPENDARSFLEVGSNGYRSVFTKAAWWAWQASREAVVIELPYVRSYPVNEAASDVDYYIDEGKHDMKYLCRKAIEAQGLKVAP